MPGNEFTLGQALDRFLDDHHLLEQAQARLVIAQWAQIVGQPLADQTAALWFQNGTFYLEVKSPAWKHEISFGRTRLVELINRYMKCPAERPLARELKLV